MKRIKPRVLRPKFHQVMLAAWVCAAVAHGLLLVAANKPPRPTSVVGLVVIGVLFPAATMWYAWRIIDPVLDWLARRGALRAVWQRLTAACVVTPLVAAPTGVVALGFRYPVATVVMSALVFVPWGILLAWMLSPRRSATIRWPSQAT